jgi:hypothetical protein
MPFSVLNNSRRLRLPLQLKIMKVKNTVGHNIMRTLSRMAVLIAAVGSLDFMYNVGHHQKSIILIILFTGWVILPFAGLLVLDTVAKNLVVICQEFIVFIYVGFIDSFFDCL